MKLKLGSMAELALKMDLVHRQSRRDVQFVAIREPNSLSTAIIAYGRRCWHYASMSVQITIRDVPEKVRHELAARAAAQGRSMQEYLRIALERLATRPTAEAWLKQVQRRKRASGTKVTAEQILNSRDADRR